MKSRLDKILVEKNLARSRAHAIDLIEAGKVLVGGKTVQKGSIKAEPDEVELVSEEKQYPRGYKKLESVYDLFDLNFSNKKIADVGASTGGFTYFALEQGAKKVFAIDVGTDQLDSQLVNDSRVINLEGTNIKDVCQLDEEIDIAVVDLSFISLKNCLTHVKDLLTSTGIIVALYKPQFEVGKSNLGKKGIVKDLEIVRHEFKGFLKWCEQHSLFVSKAAKCGLKGRSGNQEYFLLIDLSKDQHGIDEQSLGEI